MPEYCELCGEEVGEDAIWEDPYVFCSEECANIFSEDVLKEEEETNG